MESKISEANSHIIIVGWCVHSLIAISFWLDLLSSLYGWRKEQVDKVPEKRWPYEHWGAETDDGSKEMSVMANVVHFFSAHVVRVIEVQESKNNPRHGQNSKEINAFPRIKENGSKKNSGNGS